MRRKIALGLATTLGVILLLGGGLFAYNAEVLLAIPDLPTSFDAKEYCSCRWVSGRDDDFCSDYVRQTTIPVDDRAVDDGAKSVTSTALFTSNTARYVSKRHGCVLER